VISIAVKTNYEKGGSKYYRISVDLGRDSQGKRIRKEFYGSSKKDAESKRDEYLKGLGSGLAKDFDKLVLGDVFKIWLYEIVKSTVKPSTYERYEGIYRLYVKPAPFFSIKLKDLRGLDIQRYYTSLVDAGKTASVIKNLHKLLKSFLNYCVDEGYIIKNYCTGKSITIPENNYVADDEDEDEGPISAFTLDEQRKFIEAVKKHRNKTLFLLDLGTGLRLGEVIGLKWSDIDLKNNTLSVKRTIKGVTLINGEKRKYSLIEQLPKTKKSIRTVPIPSNLIPLLNEQRERQAKERAAAFDLYSDSNYVFSTVTGHVIDPRNLRRSFQRVLKHVGLDQKRFHDLRHTYATRLFEKGVSLKTVQDLLGHSNISITANIYTHVMPEEKSKAIDKINDLLVL
jgi:integrase